MKEKIQQDEKIFPEKSIILAVWVTVTFSITVKRRGRADCGAGKTFLEFPAGGDQRKKQ